MSESAAAVARALEREIAVREPKPRPVSLDRWMYNRLEYLRNHGDPRVRARYAAEKLKMEQECRAKEQS